MLTAIDSSILLDLLHDTPQAAASQAALRRAAAEGGLVVSDCVLVEIGPSLVGLEIPRFLESTGIRFVPSSLEAAALAASWYGRYIENGAAAAASCPTSSSPPTPRCMRTAC